jgi:hypothetical protein
MELIKVTNASYIKDFVIHFKFNNGVEKDINLETELWGEVFEPLKNVNVFKNFKLNSWTIEWENGADFSPEFLINKLEN